MELEIDIKIYLKSAFENGFKIVESKDLGMAKFCRLEYPILNMEIWNDRFDYDATIEYNDRNKRNRRQKISDSTRQNIDFGF